MKTRYEQGKPAVCPMAHSQAILGGYPPSRCYHLGPIAQSPYREKALHMGTFFSALPANTGFFVSGTFPLHMATFRSLTLYAQQQEKRGHGDTFPLLIGTFLRCTEKLCDTFPVERAFPCAWPGRGLGRD